MLSWLISLLCAFPRGGNRLLTTHTDPLRSLMTKEWAQIPFGKLFGCQIILFSMLLVGCATPKVTSTGPSSEPLERMGRTGTIVPEKTDIPTEALVDEIVDLDSNLEEKKKSGDDQQSNVTAFPKLLIEMNENVRRWIQYFSQRDFERFNRFLQRGHTYKKLIQKILKERGVPEEFYYLAMIESGFSIHATSHASAVGFWQFVEGTGERYGLRTNYYVDERRDPIRATHAAAEYLLDLHNIFGSWHLAMAAYNAGEIRILRAIMKAKSRDFWDLVEKEALPKETMEYVPKFLAALIIGKNPRAYGFEDPSDSETLPLIEGVEVPSAVKISTIARSADLSPMELGQLNPHLIRGITPPRPENYVVWVPRGSSSSIEKVRNRFAREKTQRLRPVPAESSLVVARTDRVRRGQSLRAIARKYGATTRTAKKNVTANFVSPSQHKRIASQANRNNSDMKRYTVRKGDTLTGIANRFGVTMDSIKSINKIRHNQLYTGQVLKLASRN